VQLVGPAQAELRLSHVVDQTGARTPAPGQPQQMQMWHRLPGSASTAPYTLHPRIQAAPCYEWFEPFFVPGQHFVPVDGNFRNLSAAIVWAQTHDAEAQQIVAAANERAKEVVSVAGLYEYSEALLKGYVARYTRALVNDSAWLQERRKQHFRHEFACDYTAKQTTCAMRTVPPTNFEQ
jgi:hypothetical protein